MLISPADKKTGLMEHCCFQPSFNKWSFDIYIFIITSCSDFSLNTPPSTTTQTSVSTRLPPPRQNPIPDSALCCVRSLTPVSSSSFSSDMLLIDSGPSESGSLQGQWTHRCAKYHRRQLTSADEMTCREKWKGLVLYLKRDSLGSVPVNSSANGGWFPTSFTKL